MNKTIKALAAICASAMLLSTSAFAANTPAVSDVTVLDGFAVSFDEDNKLTVTAPDAAISTEQMTLLVVDSAATTISEDDIIYINQQAVSEGDFEGVGMISTWLTKDDAAGKVYDLKLGYYWDNDADTATAPAFAIAAAKVTVSADAAGNKTYIVEKWGDINGNNLVTGEDAFEIVMAALGKTRSVTINETELNVGDDFGNVKWGDVNGNNLVTGEDAFEIVMSALGKTRSVTVNGTDLNVGDPYTVTFAE